MPRLSPSWGGRFSPSAYRLLQMTVINGLIFSAWSLFFNLYILERGYSRQFLGLLNSLPSLAGLVFGLALGRFADRLGYRRALILGLSVSVLAMTAQVTLTHPLALVGAALVNGVASTLFMVSQAPLLMQLSDEENRTLLFSLNYGLQTIAGAVGNLFAGQLPALFGGLLQVPARSAPAYQAVLLTAILLGSTALFPLWQMRQPAVSSQSSLSQSRLLRLSKQTVRMALPNMLIGFGAAILIPYMNVFFVERFHLSERWLGVLFSLSSLLIGVGSVFVPRLALRLGGKVRAVIWTQSASLLFLLLIGFAPWVELAGVAFLLRAMLMNMAAPLYSAFCMEQTPADERGLVNSVLNLSWQIGWAVGPYLSGLVQQYYGFTPLFLTTAMLYALAVMILKRFFGALPERVMEAAQP